MDCPVHKLPCFMRACFDREPGDACPFHVVAGGIVDADGVIHFPSVRRFRSIHKGEVREMLMTWFSGRDGRILSMSTRVEIIRRIAPPRFRPGQRRMNARTPPALAKLEAELSGG